MLPALDPGPPDELDANPPASHLFCDFCRVFISVSEPRAVLGGRAYHKACAEKAVIASGR